MYDDEPYFELNITIRKRFDFETVSEDEMRLLSAFYADILKEAMIEAELEKE